MGGRLRPPMASPWLPATPASRNASPTRGMSDEGGTKRVPPASSFVASDGLAELDGGVVVDLTAPLIGNGHLPVAVGQWGP